MFRRDFLKKFTFPSLALLVPRMSSNIGIKNVSTPQITITIAATGNLNPDESKSYWVEPVSPTSVRTLTAVPTWTVVDQATPEWDQSVEITEVFHIFKGQNHQKDGSGGTGDIQINFTVHNRDTVNPAQFIVYMAEIT